MNILNRYILRPIEKNEAEIEHVLAIYRQCEDFLALGPVPSASREMVIADLQLSNLAGGVYCIIQDEESGEMVGVVDYVPSGFEGDPELADIMLLMIVAPQRNQGLGAAVVRKIEEVILQKNQLRGILSGVQVNNPGGIRFWKRMGYEIISDPKPMEDGTIAYRLWKEIR